jgi:hypothetical protein
MSIRRLASVLLRITCFATLLTASFAQGQSTVGWKTYNGPDFSFNYPPDWTITTTTPEKVAFSKGEMTGSVEYTTDSGEDPAQALTELENQWQQYAASKGYTLSPNPFVPGDDGKVYLTIDLGAVGSEFEVWAGAQTSNTGTGVFLAQLQGTSDEIFDAQSEVAWPLLRSVHSVANLSVVGSWSASVPGVGGLPKVEEYEVSLVLKLDSTYTYDVQQTVAPAWQLHVSGTYTSGPANQNNDNYPLTLQFTPQSVAQSGISNMQTELILLINSGLPVTDGGVDDGFLANLDADGSLELVRPGQPSLRFQKGASTPAPNPNPNPNPDPPAATQQFSNGPFRFLPATPCRVADTRSSSSIFGHALAAQETRNFSIPLSSCGIPWTAQGYSLNVTAVPSRELGYISIWPAGHQQPYVSTLNSYDGRFKANAVLVEAGEDSAVSVFATDRTDIVLDINGYFVPVSDPSALAFYPLAPCRVADTRNAAGPLGAPSLQSKQSRTIPVTTSACDVPETAEAYSLNITAVPKGGLDYLSAWPTGQSQPYVSTLNAPTGTTTANAAIVPAGLNGSIDVYVSQAADVVVDINGYFAPPAGNALSFYGLTPCRIWDTRRDGTKQPLDGVTSVSVAGSGCGIPDSAQAVVLNATVLPDDTLGFLALWPQGNSRPLVSTLNSWDTSVVSNMAIVPMTNGAIDMYSSDPTHAILDVSGYFAP